MYRLSYLVLPLTLTTATALTLACRPSVVPPAGAAQPNKDSGPAPMVFNPFSTPYAVAPARPNGEPCMMTPPGTRVLWEPAAPPGFHPASLDEKAPAFRPGRPGIPAFCAYKWAGSNALPTAQDFDKINAKPDHPFLGISADGPDPIPNLPPQVTDPLVAIFGKLADGGAPASKVAAATLKATATATNKVVKVAVVDSSPEGRGLSSPDRSLHGFSVSRVIGTLACPEGVDSAACKQRVVTHLALPIVDELGGNLKEDRDLGGRTGTFTHLYDALDGVLRAWDQKRENLIINLSLGWDPMKAELTDSKVVTIHTMLETASCMGALVVTSAGNFTGSTGPIYPAGFEVEKAPDAKRCAELGVTSARKAGERRYAPLVHSVGAVDSQDQRLLVNRRWGQPRLAALGTNVMVKGPGGGIAYTPPLQGTSMSAAIVSGIAARVWSAKSTLDAVGVMEAVYKGGVKPVPTKSSERLQTEYCVSQPYGPCEGWPVRRAFLCGALAMVSRNPTAAIGACDTSPPDLAHMPHWPHPGGQAAPPRRHDDGFSLPCHGMWNPVRADGEPTS